MSRVIGIDLGTTNSCVAVMEGGESIIIENAEGARTTPSVVAYTDSGERIVGAAARRQSVTNSEYTFYAVKRLIGRSYEGIVGKKEDKRFPFMLERGAKGNVVVKGRDKNYAPSEISAAILQKMKETAESFLGATVDKAVITVPAYFNDAQRQATKDAGKIAGLEVLRIINEPTAAALAYGLDKKGNRTIVVYDLGGGTFDVSILEIGEGVFEVKATDGDTALGGEDFDMRIVDYLADSFQKEQGIDLRKDRMALQRLKEEAEKVKKELSTTLSVEVNLPFITADQSGPKHLNVKLTRSKLESLVEDLVEKTLPPCKQALKGAKMELSDIDDVVLVGGMTRMPCVQKLVEEFFAKKAHQGVNPDEVVARGAAIQGGILQGDVKDVLLLDVTPLSLGIETLGGVFTRLIERNTTIPTKKSQIFSTAEDNQNAVTIRVHQGEREMAVDNKLLGQFDLTGIPPAARGVPQIDVSFDIDANGIVHVSATDKASNKKQSIAIQSSSGLNDKEIEKMIRDAEDHAEEDKARKRRIDARNSAEALIHSSEKSLKEHAEKVPEKDKQELDQALTKLKAVLAEENAHEDVVQEASTALASATMKIGEYIYKQGDDSAASEQQVKTSEEPAKEEAKKETKSSEKEEVVDATFEDVSKDEK